MGKSGPLPICMEKCLLEGVLEHGGDDPAKERTGQLQTRIRIYLNEPNLEVLVNHVIQSKYFKGELFFSGVYLRIDRPEDVRSQFLR